jgi:hypothetical protein
LAINKPSLVVSDLRSERGLRERETINLDNEGRRRGQEAVFVTGIYAPLPKLFALRRSFRPDFFDKSDVK